jgi:MoxR-like ATPase
MHYLIECIPLRFFVAYLFPPLEVGFPSQGIPRMQTIAEIIEKLETAGYLANTQTAQAIRAALVLEKPLLIEGPPGVGKTAIAHALAKLYEEKLLRIQCYEGIGAEQLLYDYNYTKQLLMISILKDRIHQKSPNRVFTQPLRL